MTYNIHTCVLAVWFYFNNNYFVLQLSSSIDSDSFTGPRKFKKTNTGGQVCAKFGKRNRLKKNVHDLCNLQ